MRLYRILLAVQWGWTALVLVAVAASPRLDLAAIGVRAPRADEMAWSIAIGAAVALVASIPGMRRSARRGSSPPPHQLALATPRFPARSRAAWKKP